MKHRYHIIPFALALLAIVPGLYVRGAHLCLTPQLTALLAGLAILGASFLLLWACEAAQQDISQSLALAVVALVAVAPEYMVDMYFTWQAGRHPESNYAHYAVANMTGANRLLIGVAWAAIAVIFWFKTRQSVRIDTERRTELFFLGLATVYAFVLPIKGSLAWYDGVVLLGLYVWYMTLSARRPVAEFEAEGPAELLAELPVLPRRLATAGAFLVALVAVVFNAGPFSEGLVATGKAWHINEFLLVQWLAPIASEAPEFLVAIMFALRRQAGLALGSLLSAKLNQWSLLVGMIPLVYALAFGGLTPPMPLSGFQMEEVLLTAAQSLLAVVLLASLQLSLASGVLLFVLFFGQLVTPQLVAALPGGTLLGVQADHMHYVFSVLYGIAVLPVLVRNWPAILRLRWGLRIETCSDTRPQMGAPEKTD
ncbi:MAG: sodium:calcium antiporter [candidate division WS1 bacterium]|nr:sodium:calcium antiporter [candidate division WS1 bacterium]